MPMPSSMNKACIARAASKWMGGTKTPELISFHCMEITPVPAGDWLELRIQGRLDGYWSDHFADALDEYVRQGGHQIRLDLAEVVFLSSAGIRVLLRFY